MKLSDIDEKGNDYRMRHFVKSRFRNHEPKSAESKRRQSPNIIKRMLVVDS